MFMRLVTPVDAEPAVWVDLMIKHGWRKAIILVADDHNGNSVYEAAVNQATQKNVQVLSRSFFCISTQGNLTFRSLTFLASNKRAKRVEQIF